VSLRCQYGSKPPAKPSKVDLTNTPPLHESDPPYNLLVSLLAVNTTTVLTATFAKFYATATIACHGAGSGEIGGVGSTLLGVSFGCKLLLTRKDLPASESFVIDTMDLTKLPPSPYLLAKSLGST